MVMAGAESRADMGSSAGIEAGSMSSSCTQGETRTLSGCGLERCLSGRWVEEEHKRLCNDHDDDCDGRVDGSYGIGGMCSPIMPTAAGWRVLLCDPESQTAMCVPSSTISSRAEVCDGIDNDCDQKVTRLRRGTSLLHGCKQVSPGNMCVDGLCDEPTTTPTPPIDPNAPLGTYGNQLDAVLILFRRWVRATKSLAVSDCTGSFADDLLLAIQTGAGSEVVFAFSLPQTQRVKFTTELSLFMI